MSYHNYSQNLISHYTNFPKVKFTEPEALVEWPTGNSGDPEGGSPQDLCCDKDGDYRPSGGGH